MKIEINPNKEELFADIDKDIKNKLVVKFNSRKV
tara:strand:+ start:479 stop:580 length:102 start_codon:yes stop_codon:yes gene_type:complete